MQRTPVLAAVAATTLASIALATQPDPLRISEVFFDAPGSDVPNEYVEIRGTPGLNLASHYVVFLESEGLSGPDGLSGNIDAIFDLSGRSIGANGFAMLRQFNAGHIGIAPGTADYRNTAVSAGFGANNVSTIGFSNTNNNGQIENGGFAVFLIRATGSTRPELDFDLDVENDGQLDSGVDYASSGTKHLWINDTDAGDRWEIVDSIGQLEAGEALTGRGYAQLNYSTGPMDPTRLNAGAVNINTGTLDETRDGNPNPGGGIEIEFLSRWASSNGNTPADWTGSNVTDNPASGYTPANRWIDGYRVSGNHAAQSRGEFFRGFQDEAAPYGARIQGSWGRPNYPIGPGDLSQNERVDQADLNIVLDNWLVNDATRLGYWYFGDVSGDAIVNQTDLDVVLNHWPAPGSPLFAPADMRFLVGDINFDRVVDFADLLTLAQNYGQSLLGYRNGDFNHDGVVDFADLLGLAQRYNQSWLDTGTGAGFGPAELAMVQAIVPEPTVISIVAGAGLMALRRRR
jgi:hypothetical protein